MRLEVDSGGLLEIEITFNNYLLICEFNMLLNYEYDEKEKNTIISHPCHIIRVRGTDCQVHKKLLTYDRKRITK